MALRSPAGKELVTFPSGVPALRRRLEVQTIRRADLYRILRDEAVRRGVPITYGRRLTAVDPTPGGGVRATFTDGTTADADLLVGADGLRSRTRTVIDPTRRRPGTPVCSTSADTPEGSTWGSRRAS